MDDEEASGLTPMIENILRLWDEGHDTFDIAARLGIREREALALLHCGLEERRQCTHIAE